MPIIKRLSGRMGIALGLPILNASMAVSLNGLDHRSRDQVSYKVRWESEPHHLSAVRFVPHRTLQVASIRLAGAMTMSRAAHRSGRGLNLFSSVTSNDEWTRNHCDDSRR